MDRFFIIDRAYASWGRRAVEVTVVTRQGASDTVTRQGAASDSRTAAARASTATVTRSSATVSSSAF